MVKLKSRHCAEFQEKACCHLQAAVDFHGKYFFFAAILYPKPKAQLVNMHLQKDVILAFATAGEPS
jgi:hypothetical protein